MYEPLRNVGEKEAGGFALKPEASAPEDYYVINIELPGVKGCCERSLNSTVQRTMAMSG